MVFLANLFRIGRPVPDVKVPFADDQIAMRLRRLERAGWMLSVEYSSSGQWTLLASKVPIKRVVIEDSDKSRAIHHLVAACEAIDSCREPGR